MKVIGEVATIVFPFLQLRIEILIGASKSIIILAYLTILFIQKLLSCCLELREALVSVACVLCIPVSHSTEQLIGWLKPWIEADTNCLDVLWDWAEGERQRGV